MFRKILTLLNDDDISHTHETDAFDLLDLESVVFALTYLLSD